MHLAFCILQGKQSLKYKELVKEILALCFKKFSLYVSVIFIVLCSLDIIRYVT